MWEQIPGNIYFLIIIALLIINIILSILSRPSFISHMRSLENNTAKLAFLIEKNENANRDDFQRNRVEANEIARINREELINALGSFNKLFADYMGNIRAMTQDFHDEIKFNNNIFSKEISEALKENCRLLDNSISSFESKFIRSVSDLNELNKHNLINLENKLNNNHEATKETLNDAKVSIEKYLGLIRNESSLQLDEIRKTVDEKLQNTLNLRLAQSFDAVEKQLQAVQKGLGEMRGLAADVGGLKRVLSNVKIRGGIGEVQLEMLLEQILAPCQYEANISLKSDSDDRVEFAVKLPGQDQTNDCLYLPVDAKFPRDIYEQLLNAYDSGDNVLILNKQKKLEATIKKMAKDIHEKYIDPPNTTDFAIMFLPFEGIFAEVVRKASLIEDIQKDYKVIVTGPTTLAAILNSLQIGFKTLAIQKRSSEVWNILGAVKKEFENFGDLMQKAQKNIKNGLKQLDDVMGIRTRAIQNKLKSIDSLNEMHAKSIYGKVGEIPNDFNGGPE